MVELRTGISHDRREKKFRREEENIPEEFKKDFEFATFKALRMAGIKLGKADEFLKLSKTDKELVRMMVPYVIDHGCLRSLEPINPLPKNFNKINEQIIYNNQVLDPVPVLSAAVMPYLVRQKGMHFASVDGEGIYSHNEVSSLEADRAIRKMLHALKSQFSRAQAIGSVILRFKGDHFIIADESVDPNIDGFIQSIQIENLKPEELKALSSFRISPNGETLLDVVRLHKEDAKLTESSVRPFEESKDINNKIIRLRQCHPELENILLLISNKPEDEALILLGILEESLFDPRLQKVAEKYSKKDFKVMVYNDMMDMQNHVVSEDSGFLKVDMASSLKSINGEKEFSEEAGDLFLTSIYDRMLASIKEANSRIDHITNLRRWGDYYFIDDKVTCAQISSIVLKMFNETPYVVIKKNIGGKEKFAISFVKTPPEKLDQDTFVLPLMPIVGIDEEVKLQPIEEGTDTFTADAMRINNEMTFSTRLKIMDEEIRNMRPRLISERIDKLHATDVEFMLYKLFNPNDKKRGLVRLKKLLNASDVQIMQMKKLIEKIDSKVYPESMTWERVNLIRTMMENDPMDIKAYTNLLSDLITKIISKESYEKRHNGIRTLTVEGANSEEQEVNTILDRLKTYHLT